VTGRVRVTWNTLLSSSREQDREWDRLCSGGRECQEDRVSSCGWGRIGRMVVEESSHERAAVFSHRHCHKRIADLFAARGMFGCASSASEALYLAMSVYLCDFCCDGGRVVCHSLLVASSQCFPATSRRIIKSTPTTSPSLLRPPTLACPELLSHFRWYDDQVTKKHQREHHSFHDNAAIYSY
jgi:hypothetical protein